MDHPETKVTGPVLMKVEREKVTGGKGSRGRVETTGLKEQGP